jgi:protein SCO1/2
MIVTDDDGWIDQIRRLETQPPPRPSAPPLYRVVREVEPLAVGDRLPDYRLTNELGQAVNLADFRSRALGITFIFTRCPFPTYCPRMSSQFAQVQHALLTAPAGPTNWHLLTVSFDPEFDTPAVLKAYAKRWKADARRWNFLTGALIDITALTEQFGLTFWRPDPYNPGSINHNIRTVVVDPEGRIRKIIAGNEWKPAELVEAITQAARAVSSPPSP